jgi:hypothetical protein
MKRSLFTLAIIGLLFSCQPQQEASSEAPQAPEESATPSIVGAWEITSSTNADGEDNTPYRSIIIYTDSFYSVEIANESRPSWPQIEDGEETPEENNFMNDFPRATAAFTLEGDKLVTTGNRGSTTYKRIR